MNQALSPNINTMMTNTAFVLRMTWDSAAQSWRVLVKPVEGGPPRVFVDLESAFFYVSQLYTQ